MDDNTDPFVNTKRNAKGEIILDPIGGAIGSQRYCPLGNGITFFRTTRLKQFQIAFTGCQTFGVSFTKI